MRTLKSWLCDCFMVIQVFSIRLARSSLRAVSRRSSLPALVVLLIGLSSGTAEAQWVDRYAPPPDPPGSAANLIGVDQTTDGGYIGAGTLFDPACCTKAWLVKTGLTGMIEWQKTYFVRNANGFASMQRTADVGYILGSTALVTKLNFDGTLAWARQYGRNLSTGFSSFDPHGNRPRQTLDGGYVTAFSAKVGGSPVLWVLKLGSDGAILAAAQYAAPNFITPDGSSRQFFDFLDTPIIQPTSDGGFILAASALGNDGAESSVLWVAKLDSAANVVWSTFYANTGSTFFTTKGRIFAFDAQESFDGGLIVVGKKTGNFGATVALALKFKTNGVLEWQNSYHVPNNDNFDEAFQSVQQTADGNYILGFTGGSAGSSLVKLNTDGSILSQRNYSHPFFLSIEQLSSGGFLVGGVIDVLSLDKNGDAACQNGTSVLTASPTSLTTPSFDCRQNALPPGCGGFVSPDQLQVTSIAVDPTIGDGNATVSQICGNHPTAQLEMTKTVSPNQVTVGQNLTFTITVKNKGPDVAQAVTLTDPLPSNVTFSSADPTQGNCSNSNGRVICNIGTLANAATATVTIVATVNAPGDVQNTATVSGANSQGVSASAHAIASACTFTLASPSASVFAITCPANVTAVVVASCPIGTSRVVTFANPTVSENCSGVTSSCNPPSGSTFPVGTTTVTCTATDASGNTSQCTFTVTTFSLCLQDETSPGNFVLINASTGEYRFFCNGVLIASGTGTLNAKGCEGTIEHNKGDRRVFMSWDTTANGGKGAGTAIVQLGVNNTRCQITDKDMSNNTCTAPPPSMSPIAKPNKGQIQN